jgi:NitT/TauT family transport system permease protein
VTGSAGGRAVSGVGSATGSAGGRAVRRQPGLVRRSVSAHSARVHATQLLLLVAALGAWQWIGTDDEALGLTVSTPWRTVQWIAAWATGGSQPHGNGWPDLRVTLLAAGYGYLIGAVAGVVLGAVLGAWSWPRRFSRPFMAAGNAFPKIGLAPLFILIFGLTFSMQAYFIAASTLFITFYAVFNGIQSIDHRYIANARILGASRRWLLIDVYGPAIFGWLMTGLRLTAAWALVGAVVVEYLAANSGMGYVVQQGQINLSPAEVIGGIVIISVSAVVVDQVLAAIGRRFSAWRLV